MMMVMINAATWVHAIKSNKNLQFPYTNQ